LFLGFVVGETMIYHFGECTFDTSLYSVQRGGQSIRLRPKVFRVCLYLLEHRNRVVSREELCTQVWPGRFVSQATLEGVIRSVRGALGDSGRTQGIIQTSRGYGYRFVAGVEERTPKEVGEEVPRAETFSISPDSGIRLRTASMPAGNELTQVWEARSGSDPANEVRGRQPDAHRHAPDRPLAIARGEQRAARQRGSVSWWLIGAGRGLVMVALGLLGAFGLWWGDGYEGMGPLEKSRLAVMPFVDLSAEAGQTDFADGLTEELITQLSQIPGLTVIARTSVMKYKGSLKDVATIGRELRVGTILEGSIRRGDNQVRISVQLIDVVSQGHLWSQEYDRDLTGVFAPQRDIATHVAQGLKIQLTAQPIHDRLGGEPRFIALVQKIGFGK
jgi:TolB-like protein/DNA-binding winged helix-turn-helix (wHTH) protein